MTLCESKCAQQQLHPSSKGSCLHLDVRGGGVGSHGDCCTTRVPQDRDTCRSTHSCHRSARDVTVYNQPLQLYSQMKNTYCQLCMM
jgi:hypothetical protein